MLDNSKAASFRSRQRICEIEDIGNTFNISYRTVARMRQKRPLPPPISRACNKNQAVAITIEVDALVCTRL